MSCPVISPGDVVIAQFPHSAPPKPKFSLCICLTEGLFFIISTKPYSFAPADSQVKIFETELKCLRYDSYIDVSKAYQLDQQLIHSAAKNGVFPLDTTARNRIKFSVENQSYLPEKQKKLVLANL